MGELLCVIAALFSSALFFDIGLALLFRFLDKRAND